MSESHNPYTPPSAVVQDVHLSEKPARLRPAAVKFAVVLLAIGFAWAAVAVLRLLLYVNSGFVTPSLFLWTLGRLSVVVVACIQLWRGRNWARILLLALSAFSLLTLFKQFWSFMHQPENLHLTLGGALIVSMLVTPLIDLAAVFLVYVPGRAWFTPAPARAGS